MKYLKTLALLLSVVIITACSENWLDEDTETFLSPENTYTTEAGIEKALVPLYRSALDYWGSRTWTRAGSDIVWTTFNTKAAARGMDHYDQSLNPSTGQVRGWWKTIYEAVSKTNFILKYVDDAEWSSAESRGQLEGEARFFRAFFYFEAVRTWGDVPLLTDPVDEARTDYTRDPMADVLQVIVEDLQYAVDGLSDMPPQRGRITRGAAMHLLVNVYLFKEEYAAAEELAKELINNPNYALITERYGAKVDEPGNPFTDMFLDENVNIEDGNTENFWVIQFGPRTDNKWETRPNNTKQAWWLDYQLIPGLVYSNDNFQRGKFRVKLAPYWLELFEDGDHRISEQAVKQTWVVNDPDYAAKNEGVELGDTLELDESQRYYWPALMKFIGIGPWTDNPTESATEGDIAVFRLGETYLFLAEALLMQGKADEAVTYINILRQRSNARPIDVSELTVDFLLDERARELVAEENRWATLKRFGKLVNRIQAHGEEEAGANIAETHLLMPIPQTEIDLNKDAELKQNPGYTGT